MSESRLLDLPHVLGADLRGRTVLLRADLNIAVVRGEESASTRVTRCAETVRMLRRQGARVVIAAHLDRPHGVPNPVMSLAPVGRLLAQALGQEVGFVRDCVGAVAEGATRSSSAGAVLLLENLRFHLGEELNDRAFALLLSVHGDVCVNDAPAASARQHASVATLPLVMPALAGPQLVARAAELGEQALLLPGVAALTTTRTETLEIA
ncbi:phosphoglycerate kinase [Devosia sp.]|uniref:phosphoglycerate kinase n=1 Tax=Devosia sp. TaxID=1871048 RepID=UPI0035B1ACBD